MKRVEYVAKWLVCAVALALAGCASPYTTAAASLTAAERVVAEASRQWPAYSDAKRAAIVEQAASYDAGAAALTEWNAKADKVSAAIAGAHATVKLGADGLQGVRDGLRDPKDLRRWITPAIRVGVDLIELLAAFGLRLSGVL